MITCYLSGGLGNQLFQIFFILSISITYEVPFYFINKENLGKRKTYWNTFLLSKLTPFLREYYLTDMKRINETMLKFRCLYVGILVFILLAIGFAYVFTYIRQNK
jgi:heme/copper-type cytochrome/quinol oxidase subunit 4